MGLLDWLGLKKRGGESLPAETSAVTAIMRALDSVAAKDESHARYLATFAYLLSRVAFADGLISRVEVDRMKSILRGHTGLTLGQVGIVVELARNENVSGGGADDQKVSSLFATLSDDARKVELMDCLFAVASADEIIHPSEARCIDAIAGEIGIPADQLERLTNNYAHYVQ